MRQDTKYIFMNCIECNNRRCMRSTTDECCNTCVYRNSYYLDVNDWLADIKLPSSSTPFDCVEVRFKNGRKAFYRNVNALPLSQGDVVAVESTPGHDIGNVSLCGELARVQMIKKGEDPSSPDIKKVYRLATPKDIEVWKTAISREKSTLVRTREICDSLQLSMKLSDVEYQGDNLKATFYYTAEGRVDFRQLIKELAAAFGIRVEMRQIGLRQEAARVGGIGSCGRELCCTTWLTDFHSVNTTAARYQRLSLNPQKLAGQCGKLKCCLNFELDTYVDALKDFPSTEIPLHTEKGTAHFQKMDVFKGMYWYAYDFEFMNWIGLHVNAVRHILSLNARGEKVESIEEYVDVTPSDTSSTKQAPIEMKSIEEDSLTRFDKKKKNKGKKNNAPAPLHKDDTNEKQAESTDKKPSDRKDKNNNNKTADGGKKPHSERQQQNRHHRNDSRAEKTERVEKVDKTEKPSANTTDTDTAPVADNNKKTNGNRRHFRHHRHQAGRNTDKKPRNEE